MSKVTLALGSFILGMVCASVGIHTSTVVHAFAQSSAPSTPPQTRPLVGFGKMPEVPPLGPLQTGFDAEDTGTISLDGMNCKDCIFKNVTLIYGGGAYSCSNCSFSGVRRVELRGAAFNTFILLQHIGAITGAPQQEQQNPNSPKIFTTDLKQPAQVTWVSLSK